MAYRHYAEFPSIEIVEVWLKARAVGDDPRRFPPGERPLIWVPYGDSCTVVHQPIDPAMQAAALLGWRYWEEPWPSE